MNYRLAPNAVLKLLEAPHVYNIKNDELYELDDESFEFLKKCCDKKGCKPENHGFIEYCLTEGILTKKKVSVKHPPLIKSPVPSLRYLELQITDKCNLRCRHCYIGDKGSKELPASLIRKILIEFEKMQGLRILITGGEPLLHGRFGDINEMLPRFFVRKVLFTNGLLLNKGTLKNLNVDEIQISIDGLEDAHDSLRGKGTYRRAISAVKLAVDSGFEVSVSTMVHSKNLKDFNGMKKLFKSMKIKDWTVDVPCATGRLKDNAGFFVPPETGGRFLKYGYGKGLHAGEYGFGCGLHLMSVTADGNAAKCTFYADKPVGKIREGLGKCWQRIKPVRLNELKCDCKYAEICRGGCRYRAELIGDPLGKDLYRCFLYDIIKPEERIKSRTG